MTNKQLIIRYVERHGSILPAKLGGQTFEGQLFPSEISRRCRDLRKAGYLYSVKEGKFERFFKTAEIKGIVEEKQALFSLDQAMYRQL